MQLPLVRFTAQWLLDPDQAGVTTPLAHGNMAWQTYEFPDKLGHGGYEKIDLSLGASLFRGQHLFTPQGMGRMIPLAEFEVHFSEPTFQVQVARGGRIMQKEQIPPLDLVYSPGNDLFRLTQQIRQTPFLDGSSNSDMFALTIGVRMLNTLLGTDLAVQLLAGLGLTHPPTVLVRPVPLYVTKPLLACLPTMLSGDIRKVFCQAKVLEYLTLLVQYFAQEQPRIRPERQRNRAREVHDYLMHLEGSLPLLSEIACKFDRSARTLNEEFIQEYGESIFAFITSQRMDAARLAILNSDISFKKLAQKLGYSHVNHFSAAFTRKYGYGPSTLRTGKQVK